MVISDGKDRRETQTIKTKRGRRGGRSDGQGGQLLSQMWDLSLALKEWTRGEDGGQPRGYEEGHEEATEAGAQGAPGEQRAPAISKGRWKGPQTRQKPDALPCKVLGIRKGG